MLETYAVATFMGTHITSLQLPPTRKESGYKRDSVLDDHSSGPAVANGF